MFTVRSLPGRGGIVRGSVRLRVVSGNRHVGDYLEPEHIDLALRANEALGLSVIGFDMIWTSQGPMIVDENTYPGNYSDLYQQIDVDPAQFFTDLILKDLQ